MINLIIFVSIPFKQTARIRSIINLQTPGEHASCGPNLQQTNGFTYDPNDFMSQDIFYYNFAWKDYGEAASMSGLLDMVKVSTILFVIVFFKLNTLILLQIHTT